MNEEKDFFKTCFNTVAGLEVKNESQAIAKEIVLSEIENLQQENQELKNIINQIGFEPDEIAFLQQENQELKLELSGYRQAILEDKDMLGLKEESEELKKQLTTYKILHRDCKVDNLKNISKIEEMENQQKEFIEYMNKTIEELECDDVDDEEMKDYLIQRIDTFKEILRKYKSIIGIENDRD